MDQYIYVPLPCLHGNLIIGRQNLIDKETVNFKFHVDTPPLIKEFSEIKNNILEEVNIQKATRAKVNNIIII